MGFLTRWIASGIPDGAARDAALETHLTAMTDKCEKTYVRPTHRGLSYFLSRAVKRRVRAGARTEWETSV